MIPIVQRAIDRSACYGEVVTITQRELRDENRNEPVDVETYDDGVLAELYSACDDWTDANAISEYWGRRADGKEWRVHVESMRSRR